MFFNLLCLKNGFGKREEKNVSFASTNLKATVPVSFSMHDIGLHHDRMKAAQVHLAHNISAFLYFIL